MYKNCNAAGSQRSPRTLGTLVPAVLLLKKVRVRATDNVLGGPDCIKCYWCAALKADPSCSLAFFCVWEGVVVQVFNFPDDCQAINDDDFVLFFSLPFFAIILYSSRSPWAKDLAALSVESALPQHCSQKTFSTVSFTHILGDTRYVQKF